VSQNVKPLDLLKLLYQEIIEGYSLSSDDSIFFKHFSELDNIALMRKRLKLYNKYISEGIPTEEQRLKIIIENEEWSAQKEDDILGLKMSISDNEKNVVNLIFQQQASIRIAIENDRKKLTKLITEKMHIIGTTAEELSSRDSSHYSLFLSCFKDKNLTEPYFKDWDDLESLDSLELDDIHLKYDEVMDRFIEQNIKQIAAMPFFLNLFSYSKDNMTDFLKKPIAYLTNLQSYLFSCGQRNLNILTQSEGSPPEMFGDVNPNDVLTWYDQQYSVILGKRNQSK
jgi:hypothetical protein